MQNRHTIIGVSQLMEGRQGMIGTTIVHVDDFHVHLHGSERSGEPAMELQEYLFLVVYRDND